MPPHAPRRARRRSVDRLRESPLAQEPAPASPVPVAPPPAPRTRSGQLLTAEQLAERWQVPKSQVYRLTRDQAIPTVRLGRYYRYRLDAIEDFESRGTSRRGH